MSESPKANPWKEGAEIGTWEKRYKHINSIDQCICCICLPDWLAILTLFIYHYLFSIMCIFSLYNFVSSKLRLSIAITDLEEKPETLNTIHYIDIKEVGSWDIGAGQLG